MMIFDAAAVWLQLLQPVVNNFIVSPKALQHSIYCKSLKHSNILKHFNLEDTHPNIIVMQLEERILSVVGTFRAYHYTTTTKIRIISLDNKGLVIST